ncbi:MAG: hypothetical protein R3B06_08010 [Kofleriaceae bacterium]
MADLLSAPRLSPAGFPALPDVTSGNLTGARLNPCAGCAPTEWDAPGLQRANVVGATCIADLAPEPAGPYSEIDGDFTAILPGTPACIQLEPPASANDPSGNSLCRQR